MKTGFNAKGVEVHAKDAEEFLLRTFAKTFASSALKSPLHLNFKNIFNKDGPARQVALTFSGNILFILYIPIQFSPNFICEEF